MQSSRNGESTTLLLIRKKADSCKGFFPQGEEIAFSYEQLGVERGESIEIDNPVAWRLMPRR